MSVGLFLAFMVALLVFGVFCYFTPETPEKMMAKARGMRETMKKAI
jgi:predicted RND superfamily exporter protein